MNRGEVYWVSFGGPSGRRPAVILSRSSALGYLSAITVAPITTSIRRIATRVFLGLDDGMPEECSVNLDNVVAVPRNKIGARITALRESTLAEVEEALLFALGMEKYLP